MVLSDWQWRAMKYLATPGFGHTCTIIGAALTGRKSSFGSQTSAREGGRTLRSLEKRGLVTYHDVDGGLHRVWRLTQKGTDILHTGQSREEEQSKGLT